MHLYTEASLSDSYIYQELNKSSHASTTIINAIKTGAVVDRSFIEEQILQCKRSRLSPLVDMVLSAYENGRIVLMYNKQVRVSTSLPFVVITMKGKTAAYIFISDFSPLSKDGMALTIEMKKLYVLLETAYVGLIFYTKPELFRRSTTLMKLCATIYSGMAMRIFNKEFALSLDKELYDKVNYSMARFELENISGITNTSLVHPFAVSTCLNPSTMTMNLVEKDYTNASITNASELISFIATLSPKMTKLNFRYYFERWISTYGTGSTLSVDAWPYLYYAIINTLLGAFLVNVPTMSEIVKNTKGINLFYSEITKIVM